MKIKKLYAALNFPGRMVIEDLSGHFFGFNLVPCRELQQKDLTPLPGFIAKGNQAQAAPDYMLSWYGLQLEAEHADD